MSTILSSTYSFLSFPQTWTRLQRHTATHQIADHFGNYSVNIVVAEVRFGNWRLFSSPIHSLDGKSTYKLTFSSPNLTRAVSLTENKQQSIHSASSTIYV